MQTPDKIIIKNNTDDSPHKKTVSRNKKREVSEYSLTDLNLQDKWKLGELI